MYSGVCNTPLRLIPAIPSCTVQEAFQPWDTVLHDAGNFPALGFHPARCRKLSSFGISSCTMQEAFQLRDSVPHDAGSFPAFLSYLVNLSLSFSMSAACSGLQSSIPSHNHLPGRRSFLIRHPSNRRSLSWLRRFRCRYHR